jgi:hypothetical protein
MLTYLFFLLGSLAPNEQTFKADRVNIRVSIDSSIYTYRVENHGVSPIIEFQIGQHVSYDFIAPDGWKKDGSAGHFRAWTDDSQSAIKPGKIGQFSLRVSSKGAVLGFSPALIRFESGETVTVQGVWASAAEPKNYVALIVCLFLAVIFVNTTVLLYRDKNRKKAINT